MKIIGELKAEIARLKAEVDNLRKNADISPSQSTHELTRLKAEVERLTKAGDATFQNLMEYVEYQEPAHMRFLQCEADWDAAKGGKPRD